MHPFWEGGGGYSVKGGLLGHGRKELAHKHLGVAVDDEARS